MTFLQAKKALLKLAAGKYNSMNYELTTYHTGDIKQECSVYIDGYNHCPGDTWEDALKKLKALLYPEQKQEEIKKTIKHSAPR